MTLGRSGVSFAGAISRRTPRSRAAGNTAVRRVPRRRKAPRSFGNRRSSRGGGGRGSWPCPGPRGSLQPPRSMDAATRVLEGTFEEGSSSRQKESPSLGCPRPALVRAEAKAFESGLCGSSSPIPPCVRKHARPSAKAEKLGDERGFGASARAEAKREARPPAIHGRGLNPRRVCPRVVSCCRSRQAASGPEKREHGPLLTE